jgi:hypothetical protein
MPGVVEPRKEPTPDAAVCPDDCDHHVRVLNRFRRITASASICIHGLPWMLRDRRVLFPLLPESIYAPTE